jgi:hypothetical protein
VAVIMGVEVIMGVWLVGTGPTGPEGTHPVTKITKRKIEKINREVFLIYYAHFFGGCAILFICYLH